METLQEMIQKRSVEELEAWNVKLSQERDALLEQQKVITAELEARKLLEGLTPEAVAVLRSKLG